MPDISPRTRFNRAKKMSLTKWDEKAGITEEEFYDALLRKDKITILGFTTKNCGFCKYYWNLSGKGFCNNCPLHDIQETESCCVEWNAAKYAAQERDFSAYHAATCALRDRIAGMEYEEEE